MRQTPPKVRNPMNNEFSAREQTLPEGKISIAHFDLEAPNRLTKAKVCGLGGCPFCCPSASHGFEESCRAPCAASPRTDKGRCLTEQCYIVLDYTTLYDSVLYCIIMCYII